MAIDVAIDSKPAGECDCVLKNVNKDRKSKQTAMSSVNKHIVHVKKVTLHTDLKCHFGSKFI